MTQEVLRAKIGAIEEPVHSQIDGAALFQVALAVVYQSRAEDDADFAGDFAFRR